MTKLTCKICGSKVTIDDRTGNYYDCEKCKQISGKDVIKETV